MRHRDFGLHHAILIARHRVSRCSQPLLGKATYIVGLRGEVLHQWEHPLVNGTTHYLLENGNLLWSGRLPEGAAAHRWTRRAAPRIRLERKVYVGASPRGQHHDFRRLPNGNTIFLGWEVVPPEIAWSHPGRACWHHTSRRLACTATRFWRSP